MQLSDYCYGYDGCDASSTRQGGYVDGLFRGINGAVS